MNKLQSRRDAISRHLLDYCLTPAWILELAQVIWVYGRTERNLWLKTFQ